MADIKGDRVQVSAFGRALKGWVWKNVTQGDTPLAVGVAGLFDLTVQLAGAFHGARVYVTGALASEESPASGFALLYNPAGMEFVFTGPGIDTIQQTVFWLKPVIAGGGKDTSVDIYLLGRGQ